MNTNHDPEEYELNLTPLRMEPTEISWSPAPVTRKKRPVQRAKRKSRSSQIAALAICCSLVGGAVGAGSYALLSPDSSTKNNTSTVLQGEREETAITVAYTDTSAELTPAEIYAKNVNSTVGITTAVTTNYFGYQTTAAASGSGFILTEDGYIITNYHVVEDAESIKVTAYDDTEYSAVLVGYDETNDLAVLKVDASGLTPVILGDSELMHVGDSVSAIGNPLGELTFSLTTGAVSALNRRVTISNTPMTLIQTDCAINAGNSGGALFNSHGEVIGITNAKFSANGSSSASIDNIGFAIPISSVKDIIYDIIEKGVISKPYIGVSIYDLDSAYRDFGLSGAAVRSVEMDSPAEDAGLRTNDIITKVNGKEISGSAELRSFIADCEEGDTLTLTISRQGETREIEVTVSLREQSALSDTSH